MVEVEGARGGHAVVGTPSRVLVVDEPGLLRVLPRVISHLESVEAITAGTYDEVIRLLATAPVDAIVMEFRLPGGTALDFMRSMASFCRYRGVGVTVITGRDGVFAELRGESRGR